MYGIFILYTLFLFAINLEVLFYQVLFWDLFDFDFMEIYNDFVCLCPFLDLLYRT